MFDRFFAVCPTSGRSGSDSYCVRNSADPRTSRARPTFLYLIYLVILLCVVGAVIGIWWPDHVATAASNLTNLLMSIPESLWWLFGARYLGYTGARSMDKWRSAGR